MVPQQIAVSVAKQIATHQKVVLVRPVMRGLVKVKPAVGGVCEQLRQVRVPPPWPHIPEWTWATLEQ